MSKSEEMKREIESIKLLHEFEIGQIKRDLEKQAEK